MSGSVFDRVISVIISMAAVYTAFALLASWIQERFASLIKLRANTLAKGIRQMIDDADLHKKFYTLPSIVSAQPLSNRLPTYLTARQFSMAVLSLIGKEQAVASTSAEAFESARQSVAQLSGGRFKDALQSLLTQAAGDYEKFLANLDGWFNDQMDRVTGWYKRSSQIFVFIIGAAIAVGANVDTLQLVYGFAATPLSIPASISKDPGPQAIASSVFKNVSFGWDAWPPTTADDPRLTREGGALWKWWSLKLLGLFLTAAALSFGAGFWFDNLRRVVNLRDAGPPPSKTTQG